MALHGSEYLLGFLNGGELDVAETLGLAGVTIGRKTDADDITVLAEFLANSVACGREGKIGNEDGGARRAERLVTILLFDAPRGAAGRLWDERSQR